MSTSTILLRGGIVLFHEADETVSSLKNTDILIEGNTITKIGTGLTAPTNAEVINCAGKVISPGFIDTHHHLWQTQLKGRHADETLLGYMPTGNLQSFSYKPNDMFWGQLSGCLEAIDAGTTFVLDHNHGPYTADHATAALDATVASGLRTVSAFAVPFRMSKWTQNEIIPEQNPLPEELMSQIEEWCSKQPFGDGRVQIGLGFDLYFLPKEMVVGVFERFRKAGVKLITSHILKNVIHGQNSTVRTLQDYGLLGTDIVASHGTGLDKDEKKIFSDAGVYISTTPETEAQMGMGWPVAFQPGVKGSLGVDCHTNNSSSILHQARVALQLARQESNLAVIENGGYPKNLRASSLKAFNLATIEGAKAVGMEDQIGSIAVGKLADLVIFDGNTPSMICAVELDPLVAVLRHSDIRDVETVIIDGKIRKQNGKLVDVIIEGQGMKTWTEVATELIKSREAVQKTIDGLSIEKASELMMNMLYIDSSKLVPVE